MTEIKEAFNDIENKPLVPPMEGQDSNSFGQFGAMQIGGLGVKAFRADDQGIWLGSIKFVDAPFSVSMEGAIKGISGSIADWTIGATTISKNNATLDSAGQITLGTADDVAILSSVNTTYRIWIGDATAGDAAFSVTKAGALYSTSGTIGGWTIGANTLMASSGAVGMSSETTGGNDIRFWAGDSTPGSAEFRVYEDGSFVASSATITGSITATSGSIGGFTIGSTTLSVVNGGNTVSISSGTNAFIAGTTGSPSVVITQAGVITATDVVLTGKITSSTGNEKIVFDSGDYLRFYAGGVLRCSIRGVTATGATGIVSDADIVVANDKSHLIQGTGTNNYGGLGADSSNNVLLRCTTANEFYIKSNDDTNSFIHVSKSSGIFINPDGTTKVEMGGNIDMNGNNIDGGASFWSNGIEIKGNGANSIQVGAYTLTLTANASYP